MPRRRSAGRRTVQEDATVHAKKQRIECTDLSLVRSLPEASQPTRSDAELRLRRQRQVHDGPDDTGKRPCVDELAMIPWSFSNGEKMQSGS